MDTSFFKIDPSASPVMTLVLAAPGDPRDVYDLAEDVVKPALEQVPGVAVVNIRGGTKREISVDLDASKLVKKGLHKEQIGSVGWRRFVLLAAKLVNPEVGMYFEQHLMLDTHLRTEGLIDIEGFATPHEILVGAGLRPPAKK
jgi:multidrug efflux pump